MNVVFLNFVCFAIWPLPSTLCYLVKQVSKGPGSSSSSRMIRCCRPVCAVTPWLLSSPEAESSPSLQGLLYIYTLGLGLFP
ncbi:uncharacterized protein K441DRAFT_331593 [Cenococcum geophilum 1.58]|uniref:Uncharacterized protein n=1 Tax=Cenococcum geophilum 1.58 TaxID=794803 RepID=A0ACC8ENL2_9PEZI|nr:hypothetical protein K441DRAFT_331593 [Cenococcum geophilum 1.58]